MQFWGITDLGCTRNQNQDAYYIEKLSKNALICVVCDGMGGAKSGNIASSLAVDVFSQEVKRTWSPDMGLGELEMMLANAVKLANFTVYDQANAFEEFSGMGTTLVATLLQGDLAVVVNVGDSRAYSIDKEGLRQITVDHSMVQMMIDRGELSRERAKSYPGKNLITRAIGTEQVVSCDVFHKRMERGDCLLLCTDGLSNLVDEQELLFEVVHGADKDGCCERLLNIAKDRGAPDNVTCVLIQA